MKIKKCEFITSAVKKEQYPVNDKPEFAFAGRSNVGKSSLINALLGRKKLAKTSQVPGKTQTINFFNVDDNFRIVDLPGYGFARVSKSDKIRWGEFIEEYLNKRENLVEVFLLVDIRHKPNEYDIMMYDYIIQSGFSGYVFATKLDKISNNELMKNLNEIKNTLNIKDNSFIIPVSSENFKGKYKIWDLFNNIFAENNLNLHYERQIENYYEHQMSLKLKNSVNKKNKKK